MVTFRRCILEDLDDLLDISIETFTGQFGEDNSVQDMSAYVNQAFDRNKIESELRNDKIHYFLGETNDDLVGYLKLNASPFQTDINDPESLELERIYIRNAHQGKGYGSTFMKKPLKKPGP